MMARVDSLEPRTYAVKHVLDPSVFHYGKVGPRHLSLPEPLIDSDASGSSPALSRSQEEIIQMRQELIQRRLQQTSQDGESSRSSNDVCSSPPHSRSQEDIILMRQKLIRKRQQQAPQDGESCELNADELFSNEEKLATTTEMNLTTVAEQTSTAIEILEQLRTDGILERVPRDPNGELTSVGSLKHEDKDCMPCLFWMRTRCKHGLLCTYCHMEQHRNDKFKPIRASKTTRERQQKKREYASRQLEVHAAPAALTSSQMQQLEHPAITVPLPAGATGSQGKESHAPRRSGRLINL